MIEKPIDQIVESDLQALVDNKVIEAKTLEYKQALPGASESDKKEFLADVSSFANASGGDIIYGIVEDRGTGTPKSLVGVTIPNIDQETLRLDNIIRNGIQPRIPSVTISPSVKLANSKIALIIRIPKSWISPHRVSINDKFYSRSSNGKYPLDVGELRTAFNLSETLSERIKNFRVDRVSKINANETPVPLNNNAKIVLHLIPLISFRPGQTYNIGEVSSHPAKMPPLGSGGGINGRYNIDGFLTCSQYQEGKFYSYAQLFRNGIVEGVDAHILRPRPDRLNIPSITFEKSLVESLKDYLSVLDTINVEPPVFMFLTLVGVKGYLMGLDTSKYYIDEIYAIDRDILLLPEVVIENYDVQAQDVLKPCFDSVWNACGFSRSFYYNERGEWAPK